jgi:peptidoglycan/LPS O-acetylase OafA/YrhL
MQPKFHGLDHLRALAILMVFLFHYYILSKGEPAWLPDVASFGWTGVDLFFVLSGFLISNQLFAEIKKHNHFSIKTFYLKRFFRIIPAYLVTVALYFCLPIFREKESLPPLLKFLSFTQNIGLNLKDFGTFSHCWSLCVEEHFYLLLPILLLFTQVKNNFKNAYWLLIAFAIFGFAIRYYSFTQLYIPNLQHENARMYWYKYLYYPTYNRLDGLLVGVGIAAMYNYLPNLWSRLSAKGNYSLLLGLLILAGAYFLCKDQMTFAASIFGFPIIAIGYGYLVIGAISPTCFLYKWQSTFSTKIATLSYAIYLTHKGVIHVTHVLLSNHHINSNLLLIISMFICIIAAMVLHYVVEKPFMKWRSKIIKT